MYHKAMAQDKKLGVKPGLIFTRTVDGQLMQFKVLEYVSGGTWLTENVNNDQLVMLFSSEEIRHRD